MDKDKKIKELERDLEAEKKITNVLVKDICKKAHKIEELEEKINRIVNSNVF